MKVYELIEFLKTKPQALEVAFRLYSEYAVIQKDAISIVTACEPRPDGWIECKRPDKPKQDYLMFPGN